MICKRVALAKVISGVGKGHSGMPNLAAYLVRKKQTHRSALASLAPGQDYCQARLRGRESRVHTSIAHGGAGEWRMAHPELRTGSALTRSTTCTGGGAPVQAKKPAKKVVSGVPSDCPLSALVSRKGLSFEPYGRTSVRLARMFLDRRALGLRPAKRRSALAFAESRTTKPDLSVYLERRIGDIGDPHIVVSDHD